jgi:hypothetical protein
LSWRVESEKRGQSQSAWQILVASSAEVLAKDQGDLWDSGKQAATRSPHAGYGGKRLEPGEVDHWKVRCWDVADQPSAWSTPAVLEIAPMTPADWSGARWIDDGREQPAKDEDFYKPDPAAAAAAGIHAGQAGGPGPAARRGSGIREDQHQWPALDRRCAGPAMDGLRQTDPVSHP